MKDYQETDPIEELDKQTKELEVLAGTYEYLSHWISLRSLMQKCTPKKPFLKLKKFDIKNLSRKHEMTINHLYFQKLYLICVAIGKEAKIEFSKSYYEKDGLIFGVYEFSTKNSKPRRTSKIEMEEVEQEFECEGAESIYEIIEEVSKPFFNNVEELKFNPKDEYTQWSNSLSEIFNRDLKIQPLKFIEEFEKLALTEHYVFNVKLKNSLLLPILINEEYKENDKEYRLIDNFKEFVNLEKECFDGYVYEGADVAEMFGKFEGKMKDLFDVLEKKGRIAEMTLNHIQPTKKNNAKEIEHKLECKFLIILSPSRGKAIINEQPTDGLDTKDSKALTKIEIKPQNGSMAPVSGNVLSVNFTWEVFLDNKNFRLRIQCCNNRKLEEMYFDELLKFWYELENQEEFRELVAVDKYSLFLNDKKGMEGTFLNFVPGCMLSQVFKEIDKIVSLSIAMDEVIEICERKGLEHEDPNNFELLPFMIEHVKERFKISLTQINQNTKKLFR